MKPTIKEIQVGEDVCIPPKGHYGLYHQSGNSSMLVRNREGVRITPLCESGLLIANGKVYWWGNIHYVLFLLKTEKCEASIKEALRQLASSQAERVPN